jgi:signal transduction histidine kinase
VIFVTALDKKRDEIRGFEFGAVDYIAKPIVQETLLARVHVHLALEDSLKQLKRNQITIESRNAELDEMNQLKNKFISMAAHDLRNPIVSILGFAEVLLSETQLSTEDSRRYLKIITAACNKMLDLISDTLDVSVIESGELVLNLGIGSLADLVAERVQIFEPIARRKNIEIVKQFSNVEDSWFDPSRIAQVLDNLISNAIKFSPHGKQIFVSLKELNDLLIISIKDQGPGIPAEDQYRVFDHFQTLQAKPTDGESSTGLGLAIVKNIVDVHKGTISVESEPGEGATFAFTLPKEDIQS